MTRADLPVSADEHPATRLLRLLRPPAARLVRTRWSVDVHHADRVPETGGVILASNHIGIIDGPLLAVLSPRPVHALTKQEMFAGTTRPLPAGLRPDPARPVPRRPGRDPLVPARRP